MNESGIMGIIYNTPFYKIMFAITIIILLVYAIYAICKYLKNVDYDENDITYDESYSEPDEPTYKDKGTIGEDIIDNLLSRLGQDEYVVLRNLVLLNNNSTHQIDHVVVSNYGIFIIETKNYSGFVKGADKYRKWVQFVGRKKYFFLNPVIQNKGHVRAMEEYFPEYSSFFVPIVCFAGDAKLSIKSNSIVIDSSQLLRTIYSYKTEVLIPDIKQVAQNLKNKSLDKMNGINQDHINNVNKYK